MNTTDPDITMGLHDLRELYLQGRVFENPPLTDGTTVPLTPVARNIVSQIGRSIMQDGGLTPPAIFIMVDVPLCATPDPVTATVGRLRSLFTFFGEDLEPALELA